MRNAVLVSAVRTPVGKKGGVFKNLKRMDLFVPVIQEALKRIDLDPKEVDEAICGNNPIARTPARYAWLAAGFPVEAAGLSVNRACGTGLTAITLAGAFIQGGVGDTYMCGGIEMDSRPVALLTSTNGYNNGNIQICKRLSSPEKTFGNPSMIQTAENIAAYMNLTREECDAYALRSQTLAAKGYEEGLYQQHILPISIPQKKGDPIVIDKDEIVRPTTMESLAKLKPVAGGVVTGGNASPLNDGAAACVLMEEEKARAMGLKPLMRFIDFAVTGVDPRYMGFGPVNSMRKLLKRNKMEVNDLDFIECNEAFAAQTLGVQRTLGIDMDKLNIRGGAIALGHPYSATGINLAAKAAGIFKMHGGERCAITFCCGGGQGVAALFENCD